MRIGTAENTFTWNDMNSTAREYILMSKDVRDMQYRKRWPAPGDKTLIELVANENKALKFYLDLTENKRGSSLILGQKKHHADARVRSSIDSSRL